MVEETIQSIRETEKKADTVVKDAREKSQIILDQAKVEAQKVRTDILDKAKADAQTLARETEEKAALSEKAAEEMTAKSTEELKASARGKMKEAIELVISELI